MMELKKVKVVLDILYRNKMANMVNRLMHIGDVFEKGKQFVQFVEVSFVVERIEPLEEVVKKIKKNVESKGHVVFVGIRSIGGVRPEKAIVYFDPEIQTLSMIEDNTLKRCLFKDLLEHLGYKVEVDQSMHVTNVC